MRFPKADVLADIFSFVVNTERPIEELLAGEISLLPALARANQRCAGALRAKEEGDQLTRLRRSARKKRCECCSSTNTSPGFTGGNSNSFWCDEYQDTNKIQADFIDVLAREHQNVMVVGDDAQSIYSWRGANFQNIVEFPKRYPKARYSGSG